jgi:hypothetical protein
MSKKHQLSQWAMETQCFTVTHGYKFVLPLSLLVLLFFRKYVTVAWYPWVTVKQVCVTSVIAGVVFFRKYVTVAWYLWVTVKHCVSMAHCDSWCFFDMIPTFTTLSMIFFLLHVDLQFWASLKRYPGPKFPQVNAVVFLLILIIGRIVGHYCLNFLFIQQGVSVKNHCDWWFFTAYHKHCELLCVKQQQIISCIFHKHNKKKIIDRVVNVGIMSKKHQLSQWAMETQCFTVTHGYQATVTYFLKKTTPAMTDVTQTCHTYLCHCWCCFF